MTRTYAVVVIGAGGAQAQAMLQAADPRHRRLRLAGRRPAVA